MRGALGTAALPLLAGVGFTRNQAAVLRAHCVVASVSRVARTVTRAKVG